MTGTDQMRLAGIVRAGIYSPYEWHKKMAETALDYIANESTLPDAPKLVKKVRRGLGFWGCFFRKSSLEALWRLQGL